jgi:hypothetical protein
VHVTECTFHAGPSRPSPDRHSEAILPSPEDCIFCADVCRVTLDLQATHSRAHTAPQTASGAVQACIWLHLRVCLTSVRPALHLMTMLHRRDGVGDSDAAAAFMSSFARPCKICSWGLAELIDRAARAVWCSHPSCTLHEMGRSGALHACGGDHPMAVGGLAGPSRNLKPSIPVPAWPVLTSTVPGPPPLAKRPLAAVARAYESTWCLLLNNHVPYTRATNLSRHATAVQRNG